MRQVGLRSLGITMQMQCTRVARACVAWGAAGCRHEQRRARGAVLNRSPKMEYTATMKVDATVVMVARRCARVVRERTGWGSVEASKEESGCDFTRASGRCSRRGDVYPRRGADCVE